MATGSCTVRAGKNTRDRVCPPPLPSSHYTDVDTEAQRGKQACFRSPRAAAAELGPDLFSDAKGKASCPLPHELWSLVHFPHSGLLPPPKGQSAGASLPRVNSRSFRQEGLLPSSAKYARDPAPDDVPGAPEKWL